MAEGGDEIEFPFGEQIEIGRYQEGREAAAGSLLIDDPTISRRHCTFRTTPGGRCMLRDTSRNGTWLDGRRLVPNIEMEVRPHQIVSLGEGNQFEVRQGPRSPSRGSSDLSDFGTLSFSASKVVSVLVGDIRDYTLLVRTVAPDELQASVGRLFNLMERAVSDLGGTVKEYPGDAIFAFWEPRPGIDTAVEACRAALKLDELCRGLAGDRSIWSIEDFPLHMDWAIATGTVLIKTMGGSRPTGLLMIGEPVVLAFRIEKLADAATGAILACEETVRQIGDRFHTRDLGPVEAKGFEAGKKAYAILGERQKDAI